MIRAVEIENFRMLASNRVSLEHFQVLVGANATGKTTFLDAIQFVSDVLRNGVRQAVEARTHNFWDLLFDTKRPLRFAFELEVPASASITDETSDVLRYELEVGHDNDELRVLRENLWLPQDDGVPRAAWASQKSLFGEEVLEVLRDNRKGWRKVVGKSAEGRDYFKDERTNWNNMFRFGTDRAALGSLPEDPERFPRALAVRDLLRNGVQTLALDARRMREPAKPGSRPPLALDGSNLPFVARDLAERDPVLFQDWVAQMGDAVHGLTAIDTWERPEDKHLVLRARFAGAHDSPVPSWMLSDGTLRLMAITLLSYASTPTSNQIYLVEEPENGLHPPAIQTAYEALARGPLGVQVLAATHSPVFLSQVGLREVLVFQRTPSGTSMIRHGSEVPELKSWVDKRNLSDLLVTGVLS